MTKLNSLIISNLKTKVLHFGCFPFI